MGNDNKIAVNESGLPAANTEKEILLFLRDELEPLKQTKKVKSYDLETEYAKTRKNILWPVWIMLFATFAVVGLFTFFTIKGLSANNKKISVNLESFEDLNLKNLFDSLNKTNELFEQASKQKAELQGALDSRLNQALQTRDADLSLLKNMKLSNTFLNQRRKKIHEDYDASVKEAHDAYDLQIATAEAEVKQYEAQLKEYDSENVARAQEWEKKMDSERQVQELEKRKLVEGYENQITSLKQELQDTRQKDFEARRDATKEIASHYEEEMSKFDPVLTDANLIATINNVKAGTPSTASIETVEGEETTESAPLITQFNTESITQVYPNLNEEFIGVLNSVQQKYDNLIYMNSFTNGLPYKNTLRDITSVKETLEKDMTIELAEGAAKQINNLSNKNNELSNTIKTMKAQESVLTSLVNNGNIDPKADAYVIMPDHQLGVQIFIKDAAKEYIKNDGSTKVTVYDESKRKIATGAIFFNTSGYFISLDNDDDKSKIVLGSSVKLVSKK